MHKKIILKNGIRLILSPRRDTKSVTILVLFKAGSRNESDESAGVAHFLEHLMFKGTKKWPTTLDLSAVLDGVGAEFNAFTSKDYTGYYVKIAEDKVKIAIDFLADILIHSKFDKDEMNKERGVILEELKMYEDNPMMLLNDILEEVMYKNSSLARLVIGSRETISKISREQLLKFKDEFYCPNNVIVGVAGKMNQASTIDLVKEYFGKLKASKLCASSFESYVDTQLEPRIKIVYKKNEQVNIGLGLVGYHYQDERLLALNLLGIILGGSMSSRLFINVREKKSLAYYISASVGSYQDTGSFMIEGGFNKMKVKDAIRAVLSELKKIKTNGVTGEELHRAKEFLRGKLILNLEDSRSIAEWSVKQEMFRGEILTVKQKLNLIDKVSLRDIHKVAQDIFKTEKLSLAMIGNVKNEKQYLSILKI